MHLRREHCSWKEPARQPPQLSSWTATAEQQACLGHDGGDACGPQQRRLAACDGRDHEAACTHGCVAVRCMVRCIDAKSRLKVRGHMRCVQAACSHLCWGRSAAACQVHQGPPEPGRWPAAETTHNRAVHISYGTHAAMPQCHFGGPAYTHCLAECTWHTNSSNH